MTEIWYRIIGSNEDARRITVPTEDADKAIKMIRECDTLDYCAAYPVGQGPND